MEALPIELQNGQCRQLGIETEVMYPEPGNQDAEAIAKSICYACDAQTICLSWAIKRREFLGVWGAKTEAERRHITSKIRKNNGKPRTH